MNPLIRACFGCDMFTGEKCNNGIEFDSLLVLGLDGHGVGGIAHTRS